jgi:hypothetical protein
LARLGRIYRDGKLVAADPVRAYVDLALAVKVGEMDAATDRDATAAGLKPGDLAEAKKQIAAWTSRETTKVGSGQ